MNDALGGIKTTGRDILKWNRVFNITITDLSSMFLCYIMSACSLMEGRAPLGLSAYAALFVPGKWIAQFLFSLVGMVRFHSGADAGLYIATLFCSTFVMGITGRGVNVRAGCVTVFLLAFSVIRNVINAAELYDYVLTFSECAVCFFGTYVFERGLPLITKGRERTYVLDAEILSVYVIFAALIRCMVHLPLILGMDISVVTAIVLLLSINLGGDISSASAMGIVLGFVTMGGADGTLASVGAFAFGSICSGVLGRFGKWGVSLGFVLSNTILSAFFRDVGIPYDIFEVLTAILIFSLLPPLITEYISSLPAKTVHTATKVFAEQNKIQSVISSRLRTASLSYAKLSSGYSKCLEAFPSGNYVIHMLDTASSRICPDCGLKYNCWERNCKESYKSMIYMLETAEKKGMLCKDDVPEHFSGKCIKLKEFIDEFNRMYQVYKVEKIWRQKYDDSRNLVSSLLKGVSLSIGSIERELSMCPDISAEKELRARLDKEAPGVKEVTFLKGEDDFSVEIIVERNNMGNKEYTVFSKIIEELTNHPVALIKRTFLERGVALFYKRAGNYSISTGNASVCKHGEDVSGDSFTICEGPDGTLVAGLSDGMGTGKKAAEESITAIKLLENFVMAGMDVETSLKLVNSSLILRSSGDNFATMDICSINSKNGHVRLYKCGAASGYIKNDGDVRELHSDSLPFGVALDSGEVTEYAFESGDNALVVLMSDGVVDALSCKGEKYLTDRIGKLNTNNPQIIASELIKDAMTATGGVAEDDMTVLAVSIWKNK